MEAIAPNLTVLTGELVAARLISHAGSLINLAKQPASTIQIFGAEKALFRALKTKHDTPKYGLIYHASLVGSANQKLKGKISRSLAAKAALCIRVDALADDLDGNVGVLNRAALERRILKLEKGFVGEGTAKGNGQGKQLDKYKKPNVGLYNAEDDFKTEKSLIGKKTTKPITDDDDEVEVAPKKKKF